MAFSYRRVILVGFLLWACDDTKCDKVDGDHSLSDEHGDEVHTPETVRSKLLEGYHVQIPPPKIDKQPTKVKFNFHVHHVELVSWIDISIFT